MEAEAQGETRPKGKKSAANVLAQANQEASSAWVERNVDRSESPATPPPEPEVTVHDYARDESSGSHPFTVKMELKEDTRMGHEEEDGDEGEDDDDDMEEVDVAVPVARNGPTAPDHLEAKKDQGRDESPIPIQEQPLVVTIAEPVIGEPTERRSGRERKTRIKVDNPYEESDEDEEKGVVSYLEEDGEVEGVVPQAGNGDTDDEGGDELDEVDFPPKEPTPPPTTRSGRVIKLRIGIIKEEPDVPAAVPVQGGRVTRSSKRKR